MASRSWRKLWAKLSGWALVAGWGWTASAMAAPTVEQVLQFAPRQLGVNCTTPSLEEQKSCTVKLVKIGKGSGWVLSNDKGSIRQFLDTDADQRIDRWSFFQDGTEVYREIDTNKNGKPDQYRWLNEGGQKWGTDSDEDGHIDSWQRISTEELSQEVLLAVNTKNYSKLEALMLTETELEGLGLLPDEKEKIQASLSKAKETFKETLDKLKDNEKLKWLHLETTAPHCRPAEEKGVDFITHPHGAILYEANGKNDWIQTGLMVKVGEGWRIVGAPTVGHRVQETTVTSSGNPVTENKKLQALLTELSGWDQKAPNVDPTPGPKSAVVEHNLKRADIIEKIVAEVEPKERETWIRQAADSLSTAAQNSAQSEMVALNRLRSLQGQIQKAMPGSDLAAYITFREMQSVYARNLTAPKADFNKIQDEWIKSLSKFVETYPKAPDAADALLQLGMVNEFLAKETDAKKWYKKLVDDFAKHELASRGQGALNRLDAVGNKLELSGKKLDGGNFDISEVKGKITIVYYWASWNQQTVGDFAKMKLLLSTFAEKGVELVCVNLDNTVDEAKAFLEKSNVPATHLYEEGGLESTYATKYGIMVLPHLFLVDGEGKVVSRTVQVGSLEEQLNTMLKK